jgi:hypothetical protein
MSVPDQTDGEIASAVARLLPADAQQRAYYPGEPAAAQPVNTVYVNADVFSPASIDELTEAAREAMRLYGPTPGAFAFALGLPGYEQPPTAVAEADDAAAIARDANAVHGAAPHVWLAHQVHARVLRRLRTRAVADVRIDFEDGYGARPEQEEDADAIRCGWAVAELAATGGLCPRIGIRIEPLDTPNVDRAVRTLELFVDALVDKTGGVLPAQIVVTVPKVSHVAQSRAADEILGALERRHGLAAGRLRLEIMVEMTQALIGPDGCCPLPQIVAAAGPRVLGAHLGVYDFTAACQLSPLLQAPDHPMCDLARGMMRLSLGGTGVEISDGATNVLPVGPHPGHTDALDAAQREDNRVAVLRGWRASHRHVAHALQQGVYQGWDMHGAQLPARFAAVYGHFLAGFDAAATRLRAIVSDLGAAQQHSAALDDAATAQALLGFVLRAYDCGAIDADELRVAGLRASDLEHRSFVAMAAHRRGEPTAPS